MIKVPKAFMGLDWVPDDRIPDGMAISLAKSEKSPSGYVVAEEGKSVSAVAMNRKMWGRFFLSTYVA